ncbi:hypothetical protein OIU76_028117 [Salix suchowensis]|nr:hypothetical protein OIU76_028117 [Salix suchowensis]
MNKLMVLRLDETGIIELSSTTHHLIGLGLLSMNSCKNLTRILKGISCLKSLQKLDLSGCSRLEYIPTNLGEVESLEEFDLSGTSIKQLPASISLLKNLKVLFLDGCKRIVVLPSLSGLCSLEVLSLRACHLKEGAFPESINCLSSLMSLDLSRNDFVSLPFSIHGLSRLEMLVLEDCRMLESLPEVPSKVQTVNLNGCIRLRKIPNPKMLDNSKISEFLCLNCWELHKHNDQDNMGFTMLERYLQRWPHLRPGFGIVVPGNEIPAWFNHQKKGSSISVEVHGWSMGFVAFVAFSASSESPSLFCHLKANGKENYPLPMGISCNSIQVLSDHLWLFYLSFDYLKELKEWQHESFSNIELSFHSSERVKVKNCGLVLLYSIQSSSCVTISKEEDDVYCGSSMPDNQRMKDDIHVIRDVSIEEDDVYCGSSMPDNKRMQDDIHDIRDVSSEEDDVSCGSSMPDNQRMQDDIHVIRDVSREEDDVSSEEDDVSCGSSMPDNQRMQDDIHVIRDVSSEEDDMFQAKKMMFQAKKMMFRVVQVCLTTKGCNVSSEEDDVFYGSSMLNNITAPPAKPAVPVSIPAYLAAKSADLAEADSADPGPASRVAAPGAPESRVAAPAAAPATIHP